VLRIGIRSAPAQPKLRHFAAHFCDTSPRFHGGALGLVWDQRASRFRFHEQASVHNYEANGCAASALAWVCGARTCCLRSLRRTRSPAERLGSRADSSWIVTRQQSRKAQKSSLFIVCTKIHLETVATRAGGDPVSFIRRCTVAEMRSAWPERTTWASSTRRPFVEKLARSACGFLLFLGVFRTPMQPLHYDLMMRDRSRVVELPAVILQLR
jgi:hypothetical protein